MDYIGTLFDISNRIGGEKQEYYLLHRKKHNRTICFKDNDKAIDFIKSKFRHSIFKRFVYWIIKKGFHKWFFDTIILSKDLGDVIYIANSVKVFDLKKERVLTFKNNTEELLVDVMGQLFLSKKGFAPKVLAISKKELYYVEELLHEGDLSLDDIGKRLAEFHTFTNYDYVHGDFVRDHVKVDKEGNIKFIDWNLRKGNPTEDVRRFIERL